jgi:outer membrane protein assembly factor BamA
LALVILAAAFAGPVAAQDSQAVTDIRIHGNYRTSDDRIIQLAGLTLGQPLPPGGVDAVVRRLKQSGLFDSVEVRRRFRSLDEHGDIAVLIIVQEIPGSVIDVPTGPPNPLRRFGNSAMFSPIVEYVDGYGFTYGARASFVHLLGKEGRLSIPASWGARKQIAIEADKTFQTGPVSRINATAGWSRRENPAFDLDDERREATGEIAVPLRRRVLQLGLTGGFSEVLFGGGRENLLTYGARAVLDTRSNPAFPRNALYAGAGWRVIEPEIGPRVNRFRYEAQGYLGLLGSSVLAVRGVSETADGPLPAYEKALVGGSTTLRGFRAGSFVGDNFAAGSVELRLPSHSAMRLGQNGFTLFADAAAAYDDGTGIKDATWHYGVGAGWYLRAPLISLNVDVAYGIDRGARVHVNGGFRF